MSPKPNIAVLWNCYGYPEICLDIPDDSDDSSEENCKLKKIKDPNKPYLRDTF